MPKKSETPETEITEEGYLDMLEKIKKQYQQYAEVSKLYKLPTQKAEDELSPDPIPSLKNPLTDNTHRFEMNRAPVIPWSDLFDEVRKRAYPDQSAEELAKPLRLISKRRGNAAVIFYASAFLQKPKSANLSIVREDINGFMNALYNEPSDKGLVLLLHTPGGDSNAVESIVEYLHSKFNRIEVVMPHLAISGGAMIGLASDLLILGKQIQLGPIDPHIIVGDRVYSARAIQERFNNAKEDIRGDVRRAHLWAPTLQNMGLQLLIEAQNALPYSKKLVVKWLEQRMFKDVEDEKARKKQVDTIAAYFNAEHTSGHGKIHVRGQRVSANDLRKLGVKLEVLEEDLDLQNDVLTAYHLMTSFFESSSAVKFISNDRGKMWAKQQMPSVPMPEPPFGQPPLQKEEHFPHKMF